MFSVPAEGSEELSHLQGFPANTHTHRIAQVRIVHVVNSLEPGGMENGVCNIVNGLASRKFDTHVACLERRGSFAERLSGSVHVLGKSRGFSPRAVFNLARLLFRLRPAVLHTHNLGPLIYANLATLGGRTCRIIHGEHAQLAPWEIEPRRIRQRHRLYRGCCAIHTVSRGQVDDLVRHGFAHEKIRSIPNGVDTVRFTPGDRSEAKRELGLPENEPVVGLVARFGPYKRHDALIAARPDAQLLFVGSGGSEEARIRQLAEGNARVHFTGFRRDPETCYRAMDLLAIPSSNEGMSNAALEAMSCGVAALGNLGCGLEEIITSGKNGVIADLTQPAELAREISALLAKPSELVDIGRRARTTVETRFSITAMLDAYEQLYRPARDGNS